MEFNVRPFAHAASPSLGRRGSRRFGLDNFEFDQRPEPLLQPSAHVSRQQRQSLLNVDQRTSAFDMCVNDFRPVHWGESPV